MARSPVTFLDKEWGGCPKKRHARSVTVIEKYRENFRDSLPKEKQYWTLCGRSGSFSKASGGVLPHLIKSCELDQILEAGLIESSQFFGVEREASIHKSNKLVSGASWVHGDFLSGLRGAAYQGEFNPGVINYDSVQRPTTNPTYLASILKLVVDAGIRNVLVVANTILRSRKLCKLEPEDILKSLISEPSMEYAWNKAQWEKAPWRLDNWCYEYDGTGEDSTTLMGTVVFVRK